jgi:protein TonB
MRRPLFILLFIAISCIAKAQKNDTLKGLAADILVFFTVEHEPTFPRGIKKFWKYVAKNFHYPASMGDIDVQRRVLIQVIDEKNGSLTHAKVLRQLYDDFDAESLRVVSLSPKWKPGVQNGHIVRCYYIIPIDSSIY